MLLARLGNGKFRPAKSLNYKRYQFSQISNFKTSFRPSRPVAVQNLFCNWSRSYASKRGGRDEYEQTAPDDEEEDDDEEDGGRDSMVEERLPLPKSEIESNPAPNIFKEALGKDEDGETYFNAHLFLKRLITHDPNNYDPYDYNIGSADILEKESWSGEPRRKTSFSLSDDLLTEIPTALKAEDPYHEEILQRGRSAMRSLGIDSAFLEQIPDIEFGFSQIEMLGLFDKYLVERMGFQYLTNDPSGYEPKGIHADTRLNRPTQFGTFDLWNGMREKFELAKKAAGKPYPVNLENLRRDLDLIGKQQYGIDLKINDFVKAAEAAVAPVNLSPLFDSGDSKEVKYVKQFLRSKGNQEIEQVLTPKFAEEELNPRPLTAIEFLLYFIHQLKSMIKDADTKIIPERLTFEDEEVEEEEEQDLDIDEDELMREIQESGYSLLSEQLAPEKHKQSFLKEGNENHPTYQLLENKIEQIEDESDIYEDPEWDERLIEMEESYADLNYSILQNPVYRRRVVKAKLQDTEPEKVAEKFAMQDAKELLHLENNIYSIKKCFLCKFDIKIDPMNVPLLQRFMNGSGDLYPRRQMKTCRKHQNKIAIAVKRAKAMGIFSSKDVFRVRSPFNDEEVDLLDLDIPVLTVLTEEQADEIEKDRIVRGVYKDYESYGTGIKIMFNDEVDLRRLNDDNLGDILQEYQDKYGEGARQRREEQEWEEEFGDEDDDE